MAITGKSIIIMVFGTIALLVLFNPGARQAIVGKFGVGPYPIDFKDENGAWVDKPPFWPPEDKRTSEDIGTNDENYYDPDWRFFAECFPEDYERYVETRALPTRPVYNDYLGHYYFEVLGADGWPTWYGQHRTPTKAEFYSFFIFRSKWDYWR